MTEQEKYLRDEIAWLLGGLTFTAGHGRFMGGRLSMIEFCLLPNTHILYLKITPPLADCYVTLTYLHNKEGRIITATTDDRGYALFQPIHPSSHCLTSAAWERT